MSGTAVNRGVCDLDLREKLRQCALGLYERVRDHFGDEEKTSLWFRTPNPHFGGMSPWTLAVIGNGAKLARIVEDLLEGEFP